MVRQRERVEAIRWPMPAVPRVSDIFFNLFVGFVFYFLFSLNLNLN